jgi:hypothetical protein
MAVIALAFLSGCGSTNGSAGDSGVPDAGKGDAGSLPCDVSALVDRYCAECHQEPPKNFAPFAISDYPQTVANAPRMLIRMRQGSMPPDGVKPTAREIDAFALWIDAGFPRTGTCTDFDAGVVDAGAPTTCASNNLYNMGAEPPGELMNPGLSCPTCHLSSGLFYVGFSHAGTVMPGLHEKDRCKSPAPDGGIVELLEADGGAIFTFRPNASGNFFTLDAGHSPFIARISANGATRSSVSLHTSGDCNSCHTEQGANGASGRLTWP